LKNETKKERMKGVDKEEEKKEEKKEKKKKEKERKRKEGKESRKEENKERKQINCIITSPLHKPICQLAPTLGYTILMKN